MTTTDHPPPPPPAAPPPPCRLLSDNFFGPTLDAHGDRVIANLTQRLANRPRPPVPRGEPAHDFFVLGFIAEFHPRHPDSA